jgi:hypothetical protein
VGKETDFGIVDDGFCDYGGDLLLPFGEHDGMCWSWRSLNLETFLC